jgi:hypothetical protein
MTELQRRFVDNTLPQSAAHFVRCFRGQRLDPAAGLAFATFVDAYVNAPVRCATLPATDQGIGDEFINLWHRSADDIRRGAGRAADDIDNTGMLRSFVASTVAYPDAWTGWLCFQLTDGIGEQFRSRVPDWQQRLERAAGEIRGLTSSLSLRLDTRLVRFRDDTLGPALAALAMRGSPAGNLDGEYRAYAARTGIDLPTFALAYGWDWYRRGCSYRSFGDVWVAFHPLRSDVARVGAGSTEKVSARPEVRWSTVVTAYLQRGLLAADPLVVVDVLESLRRGVTEPGTGFGQAMAAAQDCDDPLKRRSRQRDAVIGVLIRAGLPPILRRRAAGQGEVTSTIGETIGAGTGLPGAGLVGTLLAEIVRLSVGSPPVVRVRYRLRRRFRPKSVWNAFEVPGLTS